jgi:hypothetical protein
MIGYTGKQRALLKYALQLREMGWNIGLARKDKTLCMELQGLPWRTVLQQTGNDWEAISIMMDDTLLVVDIDARTWPQSLVFPPTLKERTRKGWHLYYDLPEGGNYKCRIKHWENVDLLIREDTTSPETATQYPTFYEDGEEWNPWVSHVLCHPSDNYTLVYPDQWLPRKEITAAPEWLVKEVRV